MSLRKLVLVPFTAALGVLGAVLLGGASDGPPAIVGRGVLEFQIGETDAIAPLAMPTSITVAADGRVYVADGVNNRIVSFAANGSPIGQFDNINGVSLSRPISARADSNGSLWIADTGNSRVVVLNSRDEVQEIIDVPAESFGTDVDITDLALSSDGQSLWLVDNDNHRLLILDLASRTWTQKGQRGPELARFQYPFMIAAGPSANVFVTDVINGRVQRVSMDNQMGRAIGAYGIRLGELYRPKGVTLDSRANVWVSDGVTGVIQAFAPMGRFIGAVRKPDGSLFRFDTPGGIALDSQDNLYVVEMRANRVQKVQIELNHVNDRSLPKSRRPRPSQPAECTACHIEWVEPLAVGKGTQLIPNLANIPEHPAPSREAMCFSCHDGSVMDSRRSVWREHSHRTNVALPPDMQVPDDLPLVSGKIACRTCHSAHTRAGSGNLLKDAVFLRVSDNAEELCVKCHTGFEGGVIEGNHPIDIAHDPLTRLLPDSNDHGGKFHRNLGCTGCHKPHGSADANLLVSANEPNRLCVACHADYAPQDLSEAAPHLHPYTPLVIDKNQISAISAMGTDLDPQSRLTCTSCHKLHRSESARHLLADTLSDSALCIRCHPSSARIFGTRHDLRVSAPDARNERGEFAETGGPCSACHGVHSPSQTFKPGDADPVGHCSSCHSENALAGNMEVAHPIGTSTATSANPSSPHVPLFGIDGRRSSAGFVACATCHDPHGGKDHTGKMLYHGSAGNTTSLCTDCHTSTEFIGMSMHNLETLGDNCAHNDCCACHSVHNATGERMWSASLGPTGQPLAMRRCTGCHVDREDGFSYARQHPPILMVNSMLSGAPGFLPLSGESAPIGADGSISCNTCHLPHGRSDIFTRQELRANLLSISQRRAAKPMLRRASAPGLCTSCHGFEGIHRFLYWHDSTAQ